MSYVETAREHWGPDLPDWVEALAAEADATSQNQAAKRVGYSGAAISGVFRRTYPNMDNIETSVRGVLLAETVMCPARGEMDKKTCLDWRQRGFSNTNTLAIQMFRACNICPRNTRKD